MRRHDRVFCFALFSVRAQTAGPAQAPHIERVIIDTYPGNNDALAILLALDSTALKVEAITVCPGKMGPNDFVALSQGEARRGYPLRWRGVRRRTRVCGYARDRPRRERSPLRRLR